MEPRLTLLDPWWSDRAAISGGNWVIAPQMLQDMQPSQVARTLSASPADSKIIVDMGGIRDVTALALGRTNLSAGALIRISAAPNLSDLLAVPWWVQDWISVWPSSGRPDDPGLTWFDIFKTFAPPMRFRWWLVEIDDHANPAGYLDLGRLYLGAWWQPAYNFSYNWEASRAPVDVRIETPTGHTLTDKRDAPRLWTLPLRFVSEADAEDFLDDLDRRLGIAGDVFVVRDPTATTRLHRKMMMATFRASPPRRESFFQTFETTLTLMELR